MKTIGDIIAMAHKRARIWEPSWVVEQWQCECGRALVFAGAPHEPRRCLSCGRARPTPKTIGTVRVVDIKNRTITVSGEEPHPLSGIQGNSGVGHLGPSIRWVQP